MSPKKLQHNLIRKKIRQVKKELLIPKIKEIKKEIINSIDASEFLPKILELKILSAQISCPSKIKLTIDEAGLNMHNFAIDLNPYLCRNCGYIHFGHDPKAIIDLEKLINKRLIWVS